MHLLCIYYVCTTYLPYTYLIPTLHTYLEVRYLKVGNLYITLKIRVPQYIPCVTYVLYELIFFFFSVFLGDRG